MSSPLFITGIARSGTTLLARMLSAHDEVMIASDPSFPIFTTLYRKLADQHSGLLGDVLGPGFSFQDYYFSKSKLSFFRQVGKADLKLPVLPDEFDLLKDRIKARAEYECPDLIPMLDRLEGNNFEKILESLLGIVVKARARQQSQWVGLKEVWIIDFIPMLARAFPNARFIVIQRDPRDVLTSMLGVAAQDSSQRGHSLSYLRHWRKYASATHSLVSQAAMASRILPVTYENLVADPGGQARRICAFLEIPYAQEMIDPNTFVDYSTGEQWTGNSSFDRTLNIISDRSVGKWKEKLDDDNLCMAEYTCEADMKLYGYKTSCAHTDDAFLQSAAAISEREKNYSYSWRSDRKDLFMDAACEMLRRKLLSPGFTPVDDHLIAQAFLSPLTYKALKSPDTFAFLSGAA